MRIWNKIDTIGQVESWKKKVEEKILLQSIIFKFCMDGKRSIWRPSLQASPSNWAFSVHAKRMFGIVNEPICTNVKVGCVPWSTHVFWYCWNIHLPHSLETSEYPDTWIRLKTLKNDWTITLVYCIALANVHKIQKPAGTVRVWFSIANKTTN